MPGIDVIAALARMRRRFAFFCALLALTAAPLMGGQTAPSTPSADRALVRAGDTRETIIAHLGQPRSIASRGTMTYLEYPEGRIVLEDGRATEIPPNLQSPSSTPAPPPLVPTGSPPVATAAPPAATTASAPLPPAQPPMATVATAPGSAPIALPDWFTSIPDAQRASLQTVRPLVAVFLGSDWNPASKQLREQVLTQPALKQHARDKWVGLMVDLPKELPESPPDWMQAYADFAKKYDVTSYPTILVLDQGGIEQRRVSYAGQTAEQLITAVDGAGSGWSFSVPLWAWSVPVCALVYFLFRWWDGRAQRRKAAAGDAPEFAPSGMGAPPPVAPPPILPIAPSVDLSSLATRPPMKSPGPPPPRVPMSPPTPPVFRKGDLTKPPVPPSGMPSLPPVPPSPGAPAAPSLSEALAAAAAFSPPGRGVPPPQPAAKTEAEPVGDTAHPLPPLPKLPERAAFAPPPPPPPGAFGPAPATPGGGLMGAEPPPEEPAASKPGPSVLEAHRPKLVMPRPAALAKSGDAPAKPGEPPKSADAPPSAPKPSLRLSRKGDEPPTG